MNSPYLNTLAFMESSFNKFFILTATLLYIPVYGWPEGCNIIFNNKCYEVVTTKTYYFDAAKTCANQDGRLAKIFNANISYVLATEMKRALQCHTADHSTNRFWIGLNDQQLEGEFFFSDGSALNALSYTAWAPGEPDNNEVDGFSDCDCVSMSAFTELWFDEFCYGHARGYVCEYEGKSCNVKDLGIQNGNYGYCHEDLNVTFGTTFTITCDEGYVLDGPKTVVCKGDGIWSEVPKCRRGCSSPPTFSYATLVSKATEYFVNTELVYLCDDGLYTNDYPSRSHFSIRCSDRSTWLPEKTGCFRQQKPTVDTMTIKPGSTIHLPCNLKNEVKSSRKEKHDYTWMRNSFNVYDNSSAYTKLRNGTLLIKNVTKTEVGIYSCHHSGDDAIPGSRFYDLRLSSDACKVKVSPLKMYSVQESKSALLLCPHSHHYTSIEWYKNNVRLTSGTKLTIFADGSLLIREVVQEHHGNYTCRMIRKDSFCTQNHTLELNIKIAAQHVCGNITMVETQPWTVSLWWDDETAPFCYGALIKENWVVTSASCLKGLNRKRRLKAHIRFGQKIEYIERNSSKNYITHSANILSVKSHPKFSRRPYMYDVGLVKLKTPVKFTKDIQPVCLTDADLTVKFQCDRSLSVEGIVSGWGPLNEKSSPKTALQHEQVQLVSPTKCNHTDLFYTDSLLCAGVESPLNDNDQDSSFVGDVGAPFTVQWKGRVYLLGIYTWGQRLTRLGNYDYFTKIPLFLKWTEKETE